MARKNVLFIGQLPPPVHGVSVMNKAILSSLTLKNEYNFLTVNLATAKNIENIGKQNVFKYIKFVGILVCVFTKLIFNKFEFAYLTLSPVGFAFIKDSIIVELVKLFRVEVILHLHGKGIDKAIKSGGDRIKRRYNKVFQGTNVIVLSEGLQNDIQLISSYKNCYVVNNGIKINNTPGQKPETSSEVGILMLSNLIESKGAMDLLRATKILSEGAHIPFIVTFAGSWGEETFKDEFISYLSNNNLEEYVNLPGPVYGKTKEEILSRSDVFVLPTYYANECFPLTILEAMSYQLPIISTYEGAIPEIIEDGKEGLLVESRKPEILAESIRKVINNNDLRQIMGMNSFEKFNRFYTIDIFEKNLLEVFKKINS